MSQMFVLPSLELLLIAGRAVALLLGLLIFAWAFRHWRRAATRDTQRVFEQLDLVRSELLIMKEVMHHSAHRDTATPTSQDTRRVVPATNGIARGYEVAARMVRNGANKEELMRSCGITDHEAELLVKLHGHRRDNAAELIGRQPRLAEKAAPAAARQPDTRTASNPVRQAANTVRQTTAAPTTQRTPDRATASVKTSPLPVRTPAMARSRLMAVG